MSHNAPYLVLVLVCICTLGVTSVSFEEDTRLTANQAEILTKFRNRVLPILPHKYMEESIFLVRWLRARNFDVGRAEEMLRKNLKWRTDNNIDNIDNEDWQFFETEYPVTQDGVDKEGRPLVQLNYGPDWNIRGAVITGRINQLIRWTYKYVEDGAKRVRKLQSEGKNVTQFTIILGVDGLNPVIHTCVLCMRYYLQLINVYDEHYNGNIDKVHILDMLEPARILIRVLSPVLSENTRKALVYWGTNRQQWRAGLAKDIDDNQLLQTFGGTLDAKTNR